NNQRRRAQKLLLRNLKKQVSTQNKQKKQQTKAKTQQIDEVPVNKVAMNTTQL
ncbi:14675_t:CDS:1, partial [Gigaspora rosea]